MEKIQFDSGIRSYRINGGGILRFNPCDPNVYTRFLEAADQLQALEQTLTREAEELESGTQVVQLLARTDEKMKQLLGGIFGNGNDFHKLLEGVNLLAMAENGQRVITNLFAALEPVLIEGAKRCAGEQARAAAEKAEARRRAQ